MSLRTARISAVALFAAGLLGGCETKSFFDPSELGNYGKKPLVVPILKNLDTGIEETDVRFATAVDPTPADLVPKAGDYTIGKNDLLTVSITDLVAPGQESQKTARVSESGFVSLPLIGQVKAEGLSESQLEQAIVQAYRDANYLQNAQVSVVTVEARNRIFSVLGAVSQPGQYAIVNSDFRLLDALVLARDVTSQTGIDYVYVVRQKSSDPNDTGAAGQTGAPGTQPTAPDVLSPQSAAPGVRPKMMLAQDPAAAAAPTTAPSNAEGRIIVVDDKPMQIESGKPVAPATENAAMNADAAPTTEANSKGFEFNSLKEPEGVRVIRIPFEPLKRGELRYNIVIRAQDLVIVPQPVIGEYYMGGHVQRTGVYSLSARNITLKQAIIAAGMLDQLAYPARTQIVRRLGPDKEVFARVDLDKIFSGAEPDVLLKPDDQVMVGTNALMPFLAAFRSGFRLTYGFGFLYDRNYWEQIGQ